MDNSGEMENFKGNSIHIPKHQLCSFSLFYEQTAGSECLRPPKIRLLKTAPPKGMVLQSGPLWGTERS